MRETEAREGSHQRLILEAQLAAELDGGRDRSVQVVVAPDLQGERATAGLVESAKMQIGHAQVDERTEVGVLRSECVGGADVVGQEPDTAVSRGLHTSGRYADSAVGVEPGVATGEGVRQSEGAETAFDRHAGLCALTPGRGVRVGVGIDPLQSGAEAQVDAVRDRGLDSASHAI